MDAKRKEIVTILWSHSRWLWETVEREHLSDGWSCDKCTWLHLYGGRSSLESEYIQIVGQGPMPWPSGQVCGKSKSRTCGSGIWMGIWSRYGVWRLLYERLVLIKKQSPRKMHRTSQWTEGPGQSTLAILIIGIPEPAWQACEQMGYDGRDLGLLLAQWHGLPPTQGWSSSCHFRMSNLSIMETNIKPLKWHCFLEETNWPPGGKLTASGSSYPGRCRGSSSASSTWNRMDTITWYSNAVFSPLVKAGLFEGMDES